MGDGPEPIADKDELARVRRSARRMLLTVSTSALAATALFLVIG